MKRQCEPGLAVTSAQVQTSSPPMKSHLGNKCGHGRRPHECARRDRKRVNKSRSKEAWQVYGQAMRLSETIIRVGYSQTTGMVVAGIARR